MKNEIKSKAGKAGAKATHKHRYEVLEELAKYANTDLYIHLVKWPSEHLEKLLAAYKNKHEK